MNEQQPPKQFDVFLCHNSQDKATVKEIGRQLKAQGLRPWLDEWELRPGHQWQQSLEEQIKMIHSAAIFVGEDGLGPWQDIEMAAFLRQFVKRRCPAIPVILQNCKEKPKLPVFLDGMTWVDFGATDPNPMMHLIWGITGKRIADTNSIACSKAKETAEAKDLRTKAMLVKYMANHKQSYQHIREMFQREVRLSISVIEGALGC